ncbi:hypothetical protein, partial [Streptomyces alkaliphilus]|nr:hypothetical protein [Streptomyces alkaliphilus]
MTTSGTEGPHSAPTGFGPPPNTPPSPFGPPPGGFGPPIAGGGPWGPAAPPPGPVPGPGPAGDAPEARRAPARERGAYLAGGALLLVTALLLLGLGVSDFMRSSVTAPETARALWQYQIWPLPMALNALQWAGALLALPVGVLLMARRRAANGPAILLAGLLGFLSLRPVAGPRLAEVGGVHPLFFSDTGRLVLNALVFVLCLAVVAIAAGRARAATAGGRGAA